VKIATWNVNSVRARKDRLLRWLEKHRPDVLCLQEIKATEGEFPLAETTALGYHAAIHGQKGWNGVAILSLVEPKGIERGFGDHGDGGDDSHARLICADVGGIQIASAYVPNGQSVGSDKWAFKLAWLRRLRAWLDRRPPSRPLAVCGDFNVAPDERDVKHPAVWERSVLFHPEARQHLREVMAWGLEDVFRRHHQEGGFYSWWDYRMLAFPKNDGLRIDLILATPPLAGRSVAASIDREERKGAQPSDHAPVIGEFSAGEFEGWSGMRGPGSSSAGGDAPSGSGEGHAQST
jgi:exodeoxyribonuclease-3